MMKEAGGGWQSRYGSRRTQRLSTPRQSSAALPGAKRSRRLLLIAQYSQGSRIVVAERSASVMTQSFSPVRVR